MSIRCFLPRKWTLLCTYFSFCFDILLVDKILKYSPISCLFVSPYLMFLPCFDIVIFLFISLLKAEKTDNFAQFEFSAVPLNYPLTIIWIIFLVFHWFEIQIFAKPFLIFRQISSFLSKNIYTNILKPTRRSYIFYLVLLIFRYWQPKMSPNLYYYKIIVTVRWEHVTFQKKN